MSKDSSPFASQCIIQWYGDSVLTGNGQRDQKNFMSSNNGNQSITQSALGVSKSKYFELKEGFDNKKLNELSINSYKIDSCLYTIKKVDIGTTDVFLYGHSTFRNYVNPKDGRMNVRGISIGGRYVSAAKVADILDTACSRLREEKLRIWLLSCHTSLNDLNELYAKHLARKLEKRGWKGQQLIGFEKTVNTTTLKKARLIASETPLYKELNFNTLQNWMPHVYHI